MNTRLCLLVIGCISSLVVGKSIAAQPTPRKIEVDKIDARLWNRLQEKGTVRVIVELDVVKDPGKKLSSEEEFARRTAIAAAQKEVLADLAGTKHRVYMQSDRNGTSSPW